MAYEGRADNAGRAPLTEEEKAEAKAKRIERLPMGYAGDAYDCAELGVFLASDKSRYISGVCIPVDGAYSLKAFYVTEMK
jgi:NAD(P)-dependent dehydrogenase (short-subunit alcohol dehydrogenase family)